MKSLSLIKNKSSSIKNKLELIEKEVLSLSLDLFQNNKYKETEKYLSQVKKLLEESKKTLV